MRCQWCDCELDEDTAYFTEEDDGPFCEDCIEEAQLEEDENSLARAA